MDNLFFWKEWRKSFRIPYLFLCAILLLIIGYYFISYFKGIDNILSWETKHELNSVPVSIDQYQKGLFNIDVSTDTYLIEQRYVPGDIKLHFTASYIWLFIFFIALSFITTILSFLSRLVYFGGIMAIVMYFVLLKPDLLGIFGYHNNYPLIGILILILALSYYFHSFSSNISFWFRLSCFVLLYAFILGIIIFFSSSPNPILFLTNQSLIVPLVITFIFIITVAHEIIYAFFYMANSPAGPTNKNSLTHLMALSFIYLISLLLLYLQNIGYLQVDIVFIDAFFIFIISVILGIWGYKRRSHSFENLIPFYPYGAYLYLCLAIISTSTLAYLFVNYNDPLIEAYEDTILYSHIGIGSLFLIYLITNFGTMMVKNLRVYKIAYQPPKMPFFLSRIVGLIVMLAFVFKANMFPLYQAIAGYYNFIGDAYIESGNDLLAEQYFKMGAQFEFQNHRSNYALASFAYKNNKEDEAIFYLKRAAFKKPSEYAYASISNIYLENNMYFEAMFSLKEGIKVFPKSGELQNNLALLYDKTQVKDSVYIYFKQAEKYSRDNKVSKTNLMSFSGKNSFLLISDSLKEIGEKEDSDYIPYLTNLVANHTIQQLNFEKQNTTLLNDSILNLPTFCYFFNLSINNIQHQNSGMLSKISYYDSIERNHFFFENLAYLKASTLYYNQDVKKGFAKLQSLNAQSEFKVFNQTLGLWAFEHDCYELAIKYFDREASLGNSIALFYKAIAFSENNNPNAIIAWEQVKSLNNPSTNKITSEMIRVLSEKDFLNFFTEKDSLKVRAIQYRHKNINLNILDSLLNSIKDNKLRSLARNALFENYLEQNKLAESQHVYNMILSKGDSNKETRPLYLQLLHTQQDFDLLYTELHKTPGTGSDYLFAEYYNNKNKIAEADSLYKKALNTFPLSLNIIRSAANFYNQKKNNTELAYQLIWESILLNPHSAELYKMYISQCINMNLFKYAEDALVELQPLMPPMDYKVFEKISRKKIQESQQNASDW